MANGKNNNSRDGVKPYVPVLVAIISTFGLTFVGNNLLLRGFTPEAIAPDRFTGTEAKTFERRIASLESEVRTLRRGIDQLPPRELTDRVLSLEIEMRELRKDFEECCNSP